MRDRDSVSPSGLSVFLSSTCWAAKRVPLLPASMLLKDTKVEGQTLLQHNSRTDCVRCQEGCSCSIRSWQLRCFSHSAKDSGPRYGRFWRGARTWGHLAHSCGLGNRCQNMGVPDCSPTVSPVVHVVWDKSYLSCVWESIVLWICSSSVVCSLVIRGTARLTSGR